MSVFGKFVEKNLGTTMSNMFTCTMARILSVDMEYMRADVQPLFDDEARPIVDVPFCMYQHDDFMIRFPYRKGDIVFIAFCKEDMAPVLFEDGNRDAAAVRQFSQDDAFIIGGVNLFTKPNTAIAATHDESFLICRKDFTSRIEIDKNGKITMESSDIELKGGNITLAADNISLTGGSITANGEDLTVDNV